MVKPSLGALLCILLPAALAALFWQLRPTTTLTPPSATSTPAPQKAGTESEVDPVTAEHRQFQKIMSLDEAGARSELDRLSAQADPQSVMKRCMLIARLATTNPQLGVEYALKFDGDDRGPRSIAIAAAFHSWAGRDPKGAFQYIANMPPGANRKYAVAVALQTAMQADAANTLQLAAAHLTNEDTREVIHIIFKSKAERDPRAAAEEAIKIPASDARTTAFSISMQAWAQKNREEAFAWTNGLASTPDRQAAIHAIVTTWANTDHLAALAYAMKLPDTREGDQIVQSIVSGWMTRDETAAMDWTKALPEGNTKAQALEAVIVHLARRDPRIAADFALTVSPALLTPTAIGNVTSFLGRVSPQEAVQWIKKLPTGRTQENALSDLNESIASRKSVPPHP